jgi:hypothetical protein
MAGTSPAMTIKVKCLVLLINIAISRLEARSVSSAWAN